MEGRQLALFKGVRRRVAPPKEFLLHVALADTIRYAIMPGWWWTHLPFGERRDPVTAGRLQRMGVHGGLPDFIFIGPGEREIFWLELKRRGEGLSDDQRSMRDRLMRGGFGYLCTDDLVDAVATLKELGIVRARVSA